MGINLKMAEDRVHSKNLFNFHPTGVVDQDIVEKEKEAMKELDIDEEAMTAQMVAMSDEQYGVAINGMMEGMCASLFNAPEYLEAEESCDHSTLGVPTTHDVDYEVVVFNVDYRLAPGTRCPNNVLDFYEVIK